MSSQLAIGADTVVPGSDLGVLARPGAADRLEAGDREREEGAGGTVLSDGNSRIGMGRGSGACDVYSVTLFKRVGGPF